MTKRNKTILRLAIVAMILLAGLLTITGCDPSEPRAVRERIAINANSDSYVRNGYDFYFYSDDRASQTIQLEGSGGDIDLEGDLDVGDTLNVDGDLDLDGDGFDVDITAGFSIDADAASNINVAGAGIDLTIESEAGNLVLKGDEAQATGVHIDADDAAGTGATISVGSSAGLVITGGLTDIGGGTGGTADGDNDLLVAADAEVDGILRVDGSVDINGTAVDVDVTAGVSIDADTASNFSTSAQDITIDAEAGSVTIIGSEAAADSVSIDANDTVTSGLTIAVGSVSGLSIDGGLTDIGGGTGGTADGDNDLLVAGDLEVDTNTVLDGDLAVDGTANLDDVDVDLSAELNIDGELVCIGATGDGGTADGDDDLIVKGDLEVDDTLDVDGDIDLDGDGFDVDITAGASIDTDGAINVSASTSDILIDAEAGSVTIIGSEAAADSVSIDANDTITSGLTIVVGSVGGLQIDGGLVDIGSGTYATADGDNDLGIAGDLEVDGATDLDGALSVATTSGLVGNVTASAVVSIGSWARFAEQTPIAVTDSGVLTATGTYQPITSAGTVTPTISTSGFTVGDLLIVTNESATTINFADSGTLMLNTARAMGQYDVLGLLFDGTNWLELWFNNN